MVEQCVEALHCAPEEPVIVSDGLDTDIVFGERTGMWTVLVLRGRTGRAAVDGASPRPDHVAESLSDLPELR